jgi:BASS family bile acid:Na+ symporter
MINSSRLLLVLSGLCTIIFLSLFFIGKVEWSGIFIIAALILLALGFKGFSYLKQFSYTTMIFAAVCSSLFYPGLFTEWGGFKLSGLITPLIQLIMFGMGTSMSVDDFYTVLKSPKGVFIGVASQFVIMPSLGFLLANVSGFSPEIAAGIVLIGCSPSGLASNVMSYLAKANLALSITITSITTLRAPFVTPLLMKLLAG